MHTDKPNNTATETPKEGPPASRQSRRQRAIVALLEQATVERAAQAADVHASTLWRWMKEPTFQRELRQAQQQVFSQAMRRLQQGAQPAVLVLLRVLANAETSESGKIRAARCVLDQGRKHRELEELEDLQERVAAMELIPREGRGLSPQQEKSGSRKGRS
ncbi:MAG: hypothetical protein ABSF64_39065 [Bryobacteraceae bacterium]|jgi:hypothetical protein